MLAVVAALFADHLQLLLLPEQLAALIFAAKKLAP